MVGLNTGIPRCANGSSSGLSQALLSEFGDGGACGFSEPKKWSGWAMGSGGDAERSGVRLGNRDIGNSCFAYKNRDDINCEQATVTWRFSYHTQ